MHFLLPCNDPTPSMMQTKENLLLTSNLLLASIHLLSSECQPDVPSKSQQKTHAPFYNAHQCCWTGNKSMATDNVNRPNELSIGYTIGCKCVRGVERGRTHLYKTDYVDGHWKGWKTRWILIQESHWLLLRQRRRKRPDALAQGSSPSLHPVIANIAGGNKSMAIKHVKDQTHIWKEL